MILFQPTYLSANHFKKLGFLFAVSILLLIGVNILLDLCFSWFHSSAFYFSESALFSSSYWILYLPILLLINKQRFSFSKLALTAAAIIIHMLAYPALVWMISSLSYSHIFAYWQTFNYALSAYLIKTVLIYVFLFLAYSHFKLKSLKHGSTAAEMVIQRENPVLSILILSDINNRKLPVQVADILYFSANTPYVNVYHASKKYLHSETLKSLIEKLDTNVFVRIHKSHIVNIHKVKVIQSRNNGDYDITLIDNTVLRVSRNYAKQFKHLLSANTQLTTA